MTKFGTRETAAEASIRMAAFAAALAAALALALPGRGIAGSGTTTRVSVVSDGTQANGGSGNPAIINHSGSAISPDGRYVAFDSHANNLVDDDTNDSRDVFVHDRLTGATTRVSVASDGATAQAPAGPSVPMGGSLHSFPSPTIS